MTPADPEALFQLATERLACGPEPAILAALDQAAGGHATHATHAGLALRHADALQLAGRLPEAIAACHRSTALDATRFEIHLVSDGDDPSSAAGHEAHPSYRIAAVGIEAGRISLSGRSEHFAFLRGYDEVDITSIRFPTTAAPPPASRSGRAYRS